MALCLVQRIPQCELVICLDLIGHTLRIMPRGSGSSLHANLLCPERRHRYVCASGRGIRGGGFEGSKRDQCAVSQASPASWV